MQREKCSTFCVQSIDIGPEREVGTVVYDLADIQKRLKISRTTAYDFIRKVYKEKGPFPVLKIGRMYRIPKAGFEQWISGNHSA